MTALEEAIIDAGHKDFFNGVFVPIGGGSHEAQTVMVRSITPDATLMGKLLMNILLEMHHGKMNG